MTNFKSFQENNDLIIKGAKKIAVVISNKTN